MARLSKTERDELDRLLLAEIASRAAGCATYVLRNCLDWPGKTHHRSGITTRDVLRACRRLERRGLVEEASTSYAVMKCWAITAAGSAALQRQTLRERLAALGRPLPWRLSEEEPGVVLDADDWDACTVDVNREMPDAEARALAAIILDAVTAAAGGDGNDA